MAARGAHGAEEGECGCSKDYSRYHDALLVRRQRDANRLAVFQCLQVALAAASRQTAVIVAISPKLLA